MLGQNQHLNQVIDRAELRQQSVVNQFNLLWLSKTDNEPLHSIIKFA